MSRGEFDAAAALYREAQAWPALTGLALHTGAALIADGRTNTLAQWIDALPAETQQREPRLSLYLGVALLYSDPKRAKQLLDRAYEGFIASGDMRRVLMTAAHAVDCHYFEWADFTPLDRWIAVLEQHLTPDAPLDAPYDAMRVWSAFLIALLFRKPSHPRIADVARRHDGRDLRVVDLEQHRAQAVLARDGLGFVHRATRGVEAGLDLLVEREVHAPPHPVER